MLWSIFYAPPLPAAHQTELIGSLYLRLSCVGNRDLSLSSTLLSQFLSVFAVGSIVYYMYSISLYFIDARQSEFGNSDLKSCIIDLMAIFFIFAQTLFVFFPPKVFALK
jgi:hypothetical protein